MTLIFYNFFCKTAEQRKKQSGPHSTPSSASSIPFGDKRNEIFKVIAQDIAPTEFSTLSRLLNFPDNEIKEIELKHRSYGTRTMVLLDLYETKKTSIKPLLNALTLMGRSDIKRKIENL